MSSRPVRTVISLVRNVFILLAILMTSRVVVEFFGQLAAQGWGKALITLTKPLIIAFGVSPIKTPYGGLFDVAAAFMVAIFLGVEWLLSSVASRA